MAKNNVKRVPKKPRNAVSNGATPVMQLIPPSHMGPGRPTKYRPEFVKTATSLCKLGATDADLADAFEVSIPTIWHWVTTHPEFFSAVKSGKDAFDDRAERMLAIRGMGYTYDSEKIFCNKDGEVTRVPTREHVPPDTTALIFWLKNRRPDQWRDRHEHDVTGDIHIHISSREAKL